MAVIKPQGLPPPTLPIMGANGLVNPAWYQFFNSLLAAIAGGDNSGTLSVSSINCSGEIVAGSASISGSMEFGAYSAGTFAQTGYIRIDDATGTVRRLMVG